MTRVSFSPKPGISAAEAQRSSTLVVAANDSSAYGKALADYVCDGTDDDIQIQAALDALPATGGEVKLLDGTYNVEADLVMDSYQTLQGQGYNTLLTTNTDDVTLITATGGSGTEKVGIVIADLRIDGDGQITDNCYGIYLQYCDHCIIENCWVEDNYEDDGIQLQYCDHCSVKGCHTTANETWGIDLVNCDYCIITDNDSDDDWGGIRVTGNYNVCSNNVFYSNSSGIQITGDYNTCNGNVLNACVTSIKFNGCDYSVAIGNTIALSTWDGFYLNNLNHCVIANNTIYASSQTADNTHDNMVLIGLVNDCLITGNVIRMGALANQPKYGINIENANCNRNMIVNNDLYDSGKTANFIDGGTGTKLAVYVVPFSHGSDPQDSGYEIDEAAEFARAWLRLPAEVQQVVRMKIYARAVILSAAAMRLEVNVNGGADNEPFNTHATAAPDTPSTSTNFAADDVIFWTLTSAQIIALIGGDSVEVKVLHEAAGNGDVITDAFFRTVEFEYV